MELTKGIMLDGRYKLLKALGNGATAQVWLAHDSLANLRVAVKVFDAIEGDGITDFQQEFSRVYNINHQNLLTPTNYSVSGDVPYLVMPYCENGSAKSMVGRCDQNDIVPFIRDVAAALATLHANNIVHQDIKPENIMIDDNISFKVTDFGISMARDDENLSYGGTYPYMAAERFNGVLEPSGDIWAFGATIFEMLEGKAPFGPDGGISQAQGNPIPPVTKTKLDGYLYDLICRMLDPDPALRPTAEKIQADMEFFQRYKRWPDHNPVLQYTMAAVILAVFTLGLWIWSETRTKVYYCKDYVEVNREPQMIDKLTGSEHAQRFYSYRVEVQRGHVRRVTLVNAKGYPLAIKDYRQLPLRYPDQEYSYSGEFFIFGGQVDKVVCRDENGCQVLSYNYETDKGGNEYIEFKKSNDAPQYYTSTYYSQAGLQELYPGNSRIVRMYVTYDSIGRVSMRKYSKQSGNPISDANDAYGHKFTYNEIGQVTSVSHLDANLTDLVGDATGCAVRRFEYDDAHNLIRVSMFDKQGASVCDYQGRAVIDMVCDQYGNVTQETHKDASGNRVQRRSDGAYGFRVSYENGFCKQYTILNGSGEAMEGNSGYAFVRFEIDSITGHDRCLRYYLADSTTYVYGCRFEYDEMGRATRSTFIDEDGKPTIGPDGYCSYTLQYDDEGHLQVQALFDREDAPIEVFGRHSATYYYSEGWRLDSIANFDTVRGKTADQDGICVVKYSYDDKDNRDEFNSVPITVSYFDTDGNPVLSRNGYAGKKNKFDTSGRLIGVEYQGVDKNAIKLFGSISSIAIYYEGARVSKVQGLDGGKVVCEVNASLMPDGRQLLTAPAISAKPVAFYEETTGTSRSVIAKDADGNSIDVVMPNGGRGYCLRRDADGNISTYNSNDEVAKGSIDVRAVYYIISTYFYDYLLLYPNYVIAQDTPATVDPVDGSTPVTHSGQSPLNEWQRNLQAQNRSLPSVLYAEDGYGWQLEKYEWSDNMVIVVLRAKHISGTSDYDMEDVNEYVNRFKTYPQRVLGVPNTVTVKVRVLNNQRQTILQR
ncbi:MAG: serine/threonine-protein kinase [Muribaculaceae bacterium]